MTSPKICGAAWISVPMFKADDVDLLLVDQFPGRDRSFATGQAVDDDPAGATLRLVDLRRDDCNLPPFGEHPGQRMKTAERAGPGDAVGDACAALLHRAAIRLDSAVGAAARV